jgi:threonyl-tRNA synthetase
VSKCTDMLFSVYSDFGFNDVVIKLSTRPESRVGSDEVWDKAEKALLRALEKKKLAYDLQPGEGAFYGPKIEFALRDCIGRIWQCGTIQVDFAIPARLGAQYVAEDSSRKTPVMVHRAILGSLERFIGILIEHYAGHFPIWLTPIQAVVMNITDRQEEYAENVAKKLQKLGVRVKTDLRNEKIGFKIREHTLQKLPFQLIVGDREAETDTVAVRTRSGEDLGSMSIDAFCDLITRENSKRGR